MADSNKTNPLDFTKVPGFNDFQNDVAEKLDKVGYCEDTYNELTKLLEENKIDQLAMEMKMRAWQLHKIAAVIATEAIRQSYL